ncbi:putative S-adenosylmethionine synthase 4 [Dermatophagoides farinae]|uniref:putative S-adenosylmethionine synthase 4 n=1 Tax=Dermatophagoides farinae TaxID=6954 RepID=UPI003F60ADCA
MYSYLFTSESVTEGHPDKICDQISDAILDSCLALDPQAKVACECAVKNEIVFIFGEISVKGVIDYESIARNKLKEIGYDSKAKGLDYKTCKIQVMIDEQSPEIAKSVHLNKSLDDVGAGDQGLVFGYACDETKELMPLSHLLANKLALRLSEVRKKNILRWVGPDGKTQVTVEYEQHENEQLVPKHVNTVVISTQHTPDVSIEKIREDLITHVITPIIPKQFLDENTRYILNPSGEFTVGGPHGDAGLTGRKIIVDTYGGWGSHGGGAFSGKDCTKIDRSAAYAARHAAKCLVANNLCSRVLIQVSYAIGVADPVSIYVNSYKTAKSGLSDRNLETIVKKNFDFRPGAIIKSYGLTAPIFSETATYGHFGRPQFVWEQVKKLEI